uniref:Uncharacterized protein n=1 Tax=Anguilla anguilla TaxID=7936 RepID=A0A0E9WFS9_ANGAN
MALCAGLRLSAVLFLSAIDVFANAHYGLKDDWARHENTEQH